MGLFVSDEKWWNSVVEQKKLQNEVDEAQASLKSRPRSLFGSSNILKKYGLDL